MLQRNQRRIAVPPVKRSCIIQATVLLRTRVGFGEDDEHGLIRKKIQKRNCKDIIQYSM